VDGTLTGFAAERLAAAGDRERAAAMARYMKTDMPFYGVPKPARAKIAREMLQRFPVETREAYESAVLALWERPHREEKYLAIDLARHHRRFIVFAGVPLYERLIVEGAWWDFVDDVAARLAGRVLLAEREPMRPVVTRWVDAGDMWLRRAAVISQLLHGEETDAAMLFDFCLRRAGEKEFFIRKAIGWALRQYARTDPDAVRRFLLDHGDELSGLSVREAAKHLDPL
jgi:3-methyladenine DNA glycosylase AlkD